MRYEFVYKRLNDWSFEESAMIERAIEFVKKPAEGNLYSVVGAFLADIIKVKYLIIGRVNLPAAETVSTLCFLQNGQEAPNFTYNLKGTPCDNVVRQEVCYYPFGVQEAFPDDAELVEMGAESYMGAPLLDNEGKTIGLTVLLHDTTIENPGFIEHILTIVSPILEQQLLFSKTKST